MSGNPEQEYFSDGVSEDIITDLSKLSRLTVIARNSSFNYKGSEVNIQQVGKELGVHYLVHGSIRKAGNRIHVNVQLVETENGHNLWAERYDRELTDVFALQDDITEQIVNALSVQLSEEEKQNIEHPKSNNFEAYDLFLQGRKFANIYTKEGGEQAIDIYE